MSHARERALEVLERAIRDGVTAGADPAVIARDALARMDGIGIRPAEVRPAADWSRRGGGTPPGEDYRKARAEWEARPHPHTSRPEDAA